MEVSHFLSEYKQLSSLFLTKRLKNEEINKGLKSAYVQRMKELPSHPGSHQIISGSQNVNVISLAVCWGGCWEPGEKYATKLLNIVNFICKNCAKSNES